MFEIDFLLFWLLCCSFIRDPSSIEGKIIYLATDDIINTACFFRFNNNIIWSQSSSASWFISQRVWNWSCLMKIYCILILIFLLNPIQKEKIFRELFIGAFLFFKIENLPLWYELERNLMFFLSIYVQISRGSIQSILSEFLFLFYIFKLLLTFVSSFLVN